MSPKQELNKKMALLECLRWLHINDARDKIAKVEPGHYRIASDLADRIFFISLDGDGQHLLVPDVPPMQWMGVLDWIEWKWENSALVLKATVLDKVRPTIIFEIPAVDPEAFSGVKTLYISMFKPNSPEMVDARVVKKIELI